MKGNIKEKAFTLIELLAVIVILAIIALIAVPVILNIIDKANKSAFKDSAYGIIQAGEYYYAARQLDFEEPIEDVITMSTTDSRLELKGKIPNGEISITKDGDIAIEVTNGRYCATKGFDDKDVTITEGNCKLSYSLGDTVYFNPVENDICPDDYKPENSKTEFKDGCMKWYVYKIEDGRNYMILDHNTTAITDWLSLEDLFSSGATSKYDLAPISLSNQLKTDTTNWQAPAYILSNEEMMELIPYFNDLKKQGINWQDKYEEYTSMVVSKLEEVGNSFDESSYETEDELIDALLDELYKTGYYLPKYMHRDIFKSLLSGNTEVSGYWTGSSYPDFIPSEDYNVGSFLGFFVLEGMSVLYPFPAPYVEAYENSGFPVPGLRPTIVINNNGKAIEKLDATQIRFNETNLVMLKEDTYQLTARVISNFIEDPNVNLVWSSSDESIVTVDQTGLVSSLKDGKATITVEIKGNSNIKNTINVTVQTYEQGIMKSVNSCIGTGTCESGTKVRVAVNDEKNYDFYVIADDGSTVTLIMSENLGDNVEWYADVADNSYGPTTALAELALRTNDWEIPEFTYQLSGLGEDGKTQMYPDSEVTAKARLITYAEANAVGCTTNDGICPAWMYDNLYDTGSDYDSVGEPKYGYWTSTAYAGSSGYVFFVNWRGYLYDNKTTDSDIGLRPVIELSK